MASDSCTNPINRFTYDWLVRLTELLPPETFSASEKFLNISPLFTALYEEYGAKRVILMADCNIISLFESIAPLNSKKQTIVSGNLYIVGLKKGTIDALVARRISFFSLGTLQIKNSRLSFNDLKYFLRGVPQSFEIFDCVLTEPVNMSQLWPYLKKSSWIQIHLQNLDYDDEFSETLLNHPSLERMHFLSLQNIPFDQKYITSIIESLLLTETSRNIWFKLNEHVSFEEVEKFENKLFIKAKEAGQEAGITVRNSNNDYSNVTGNQSDNSSSSAEKWYKPEADFLIKEDQEFDWFHIFTSEKEWKKHFDIEA